METIHSLIERGRFAAESHGPTPCVDCSEPVPWPARICNECEGKRVRKSRVASSLRSIPSAFEWCAFDAPELLNRVKSQSAIAVGRAYRDVPKLIVRGPSGRGKTHLVAAMFRARIEAVPELTGFFVAAYDLGDAMSRSETSDPSLVRRARGCDLLVIDDLGQDQEIPSNPIPKVILDRYAQNKATWITTGLTETQIQERYRNDGVSRRINERTFEIDCGAE